MKTITAVITTKPQSLIIHMTTVSQTQLSTNTIHKTTLTHLSIVSPSNPMHAGMGWDNRGFSHVATFVKFSTSGAAFCHGCTDSITSNSCTKLSSVPTFIFATGILPL